MLPEKAQGKVVEAVVVAVGAGARKDVSKGVSDLIHLDQPENV